MSEPDSRIAEAVAAIRAEHGPTHYRHEMWAAMADLLDCIGTDYAPYWNEPYAAGFIPVIEKAIRAAKAYTEAPR